MDFDFSDDAKTLREQARKLFDERAGPAVARKHIDGDGIDRDLWRTVVELGWTAARVPEAHGGIGLSAEASCVLAEEAGRALAAVPLGSVLAATEALIALGSPEQQARWLPGIADGSVVAVPAWAEGGLSPAKAGASVSGGRISGTKAPVPDLAAAQLAIVSASGPDGVGLYLVDLTGPDVAVEPVETLDLVRRHGGLTLTGAPAEPLGGPSGYHDWLDRAAVLGAFEALGTATAAMDMAVAYAKERVAFGQKIGRYQGVKHKCADMFIKLELARAHALHAAWAMGADAAELRQAASAARVASLDALAFCAEENVQIHGGIGYTWDSDCQFYYRRNRALAAALGSRTFWADRLVRSLEQRNAVAA
ncbi:MAG: acyl-CoA/acyl-ACP dehydrogenase [Sphingomonadaceae bacterium]|nr:acyl-CoA/acyl-ACP dehydrogenase [Sphingomonadaceae bacterium]